MHPGSYSSPKLYKGCPGVSIEISIQVASGTPFKGRGAGSGASSQRYGPAHLIIPFINVNFLREFLIQLEYF